MSSLGFFDDTTGMSTMTAAPVRQEELLVLPDWIQTLLLRFQN